MGAWYAKSIMVQQHMSLLRNDDEMVVQLPAESDEREIATTVSIDEYRTQAKRRKVLKEMGRNVLAYYTVESTLSVVPISVNYRSSGDISVHYAEYREGCPEDDYGIVHLGWSGKPETKRIVATWYDSDVDLVSAALLRSRNLRYLESDLRTRRHMPEHDTMIREAAVQLMVAEEKIKLAR